MDDLELSLIALQPTCSVCSYRLDGQTYHIRLLACKHVFCQHCLLELAKDSCYTCPFDDGQAIEIPANDVYQALMLACAHRTSTNRALFAQSLSQLESSFSRVKVPCKEQSASISGNCPNPIFCKLDHSLNFYKRYLCPRTQAGETCWRGEYCLFSHIKPTATVQGTLTIRSRSLLNYVNSGGPRYLQIVRQHGAQIESIEPYEVQYTTMKKWVFDNSAGRSALPTEFEEETQGEIQFAAEHYKSFVELKNFKVFFKPQYLVMSDYSVYRIACTSLCVASTPAAVLTYRCAETWAQSFVSAVTALEMEVCDALIGNQQLSWCKRFGFAYINYQIVGFDDELRGAMETKPGFNEYDDVIEKPFEFNAARHSLAGKPVEIFPGKLVGLRTDVEFIVNQAAGTSPVSQGEVKPPCPQVPLHPPRLAPNPSSSKPISPLQGNSPVPQFRGRSPDPRKPQKKPIRSSTPSASDTYIQSLVRKSLPGAQVISIKHLPTSPASLRFDSKVSMLTTRRVRPETKLLFHGTKDDDPNDFAMEGLNERARRGKYGLGLYFYEQLSAIDAYSFVNDCGQKQTLLCEVITGNSLVSEPHYFQSPPIDMKTRQPYQSVTGRQRGSSLWVVFDEDMSVPRIVITYQ